MPVMDGFEATFHLRTIPASGRLPIVALTASVLASDRQRCLDAGMDDALAKPLRRPALAQTLAVWVQKPAA